MEFFGGFRDPDSDNIGWKGGGGGENWLICALFISYHFGKLIFVLLLLLMHT